MTPPQNTNAPGGSGRFEENPTLPQNTEYPAEAVHKPDTEYSSTAYVPLGSIRDPLGWSGLDYSPSGVSASAGFFNWLLSSGDVVCDEQTFRLHGLAPDADPQFETFLGQVPPEDVEDLLRTLNPLLGEIGDYIFEYRVRWPDGEVHTLEGLVPELSLTIPPLAAIFRVPEI